MHDVATCNLMTRRTLAYYFKQCLGQVQSMLLKVELGPQLSHHAPLLSYDGTAPHHVLTL